MRWKMLYRVEIKTEVYVDADTIDEAEEYAKDALTQDEQAEFAQYDVYPASLETLDKEWAISYPFGKQKTNLKTCKQILENSKC